MVVISGYAVFTGKLTTILGAFKSWFNEFIIENPTIFLITMVGLLTIIVIDIFKDRKEMKKTQGKQKNRKW